MAIFAHPDDEGAFAGTLAHYANHQTEVMLICATKGEAGEIADPSLVTPETLAGVRVAELRAACDIMGICELYYVLITFEPFLENTPGDCPASMGAGAFYLGSACALSRSEIKPTGLGQVTD